MAWTSRVSWRLVAAGAGICLLVVAAIVIVAVRSGHERSGGNPAVAGHKTAPAVLAPSLIGSDPVASPVDSVALSPDGRTAAVRLTSGTIELLDTATGATEATLKAGQIDADYFVSTDVAFSPDGKTLAAGAEVDKTGSSSQIELWDVTTGQLSASFTVAVPNVYSLAFSPDGRTIAVGGGKSFALCDIPHHSVLTVPDDKFVSYQGDASYVSYSADGRTLVVADNRGLIRIWDVRTARFTRDETIVLTNPDDGRAIGDITVYTAVISPDGTTVANVADPNQASGSNEDLPAIWLWHLGSGKLTSLAGTAAGSTLTFSPDGALLAVGDASGRTTLWNTATSRPVGSLEAPSGDESITSVAFSRDGRTLAAAQSVGYEQQGQNVVESWNLYGPAVAQ